MKWFPTIKSRDDATRLVRTTSGIFYALAAVQVGIAILILLLDAKTRFYTGLSLDTGADLLATAVIIASLASALRSFNSRTAAIALLLVLLAIAATTVASHAHQSQKSGSLLFAIFAAAAAINAIRATFWLHKITPAESKPQAPLSRPDFVSHPKGGLESTTATAAASQSPKPYDREKWAALLKYDDEIATVAGRISPLGPRWLDEFAHAYLVLNDKQYLRRIEEKIFADARAEKARSRL